MKYSAPKRLGLLAGALGLCLLSSAAFAQRNSVWTGSVSGDWSNQANWDGTLGNDGATTLQYNGAGPVTSFLNTTRTINRLEFSGSVSRNVRYSNSASGSSSRSLIFAVAAEAGTPTIEVKAGTAGTLTVGHGGVGQTVIAANLDLINKGTGSLIMANEILQLGSTVTAGTNLDVTASGTGTIWLAGQLRHYGDTIVQSGGTLRSNDLGSVLFRIGESGVSNKVTGAGTFSSNGEFLIDLTGASMIAGNSWMLVDSSLESVAYGNLFNVKSTLGSFTKEGSLWTINENNMTYQFSQDTGMLTVIPESSSAALLGFGALVAAFVGYKRGKRLRSR